MNSNIKAPIKSRYDNNLPRKSYTSNLPTFAVWLLLLNFSLLNFSQSNCQAEEAPIPITSGSTKLMGTKSTGNKKGKQAKKDWLKVPTLKTMESPSETVISQSLEKGVHYLISSQNKNGSWGAATRTKDLNIYAPIPGSHHAFRMATTSLCLCALIELESEYPKTKPNIDRAEKWLIEHLPKLKRATPEAIYNVWGHLYSIQALSHMYKRHPKDKNLKAKIGNLIKLQYEMLGRYESVDGGWGYYDMRYHAKKPTSSSISFVTGAALVAFAEAKAIGFPPPSKLVKRGIASLHRQQKPDFSYLYGEYLKSQPMRGINLPGGSLGRSQCCNLALKLWGDKKVTDKVIIAWQNRLYSRNGWLDIGRKRPIPHESWMGVAGYFYYFGHYYAAVSFEEIPQAARTDLKAHMAKLMLDRQEKDGSWWDYPLYSYHQPYGTGLALMTLSRCREKSSETSSKKNSEKTATIPLKSKATQK